VEKEKEKPFANVAVGNVVAWAVELLQRLLLPIVNRMP
jgi:hypothetical protein